MNYAKLKSDQTQMHQEAENWINNHRKTLLAKPSKIKIVNKRRITVIAYLVGISIVIRVSMLIFAAL